MIMLILTDHHDRQAMIFAAPDTPLDRLIALVQAETNLADSLRVTARVQISPANIHPSIDLYQPYTA